MFGKVTITFNVTGDMTRESIMNIDGKSILDISEYREHKITNKQENCKILFKTLNIMSISKEGRITVLFSVIGLFGQRFNKILYVTCDNFLYL